MRAFRPITEPAASPSPSAPEPVRQGADRLDAVESRLAWILGSPRTGSTWLLRMLVHPFTLSRSPTGMRAERRASAARPPGIVPVNESHLPIHLTPMKLLYERPEATTDPSQMITNTERLGDAAYFFNEIYADTWRPLVRKLALARFDAQASRAVAEHGLDPDAAIVVKEPNGSHGAQLLMSLLPGAKLVFLMRDGRDVVDSQLALRLGGVRGMKPRDRFDRQRTKWLRRNAGLWVSRMNAVGAAYEDHPPELRMRLRYEELLAEPRARLAELFEFLGVERTEEEIDAAVEEQSFAAIPAHQKGVGRGKRAAQPGLWRENLRPKEQAIVNEVMGEKLVELGYEV